MLKYFYDIVPGANPIKVFCVNLLTLFASWTISAECNIMFTVRKGSSLQKSESKHTPKKFL
jgi:hypothetical protein